MVKWLRVALYHPVRERLGEGHVGGLLSISGDGYYFEGELFEDFWIFGDGLDEDSLCVTYGDDGGIGFDGRLSDTQIETA